jgi:hypothetical protein
MSQQSDAPCYEYQRMCKSFDDAVAEISRLRIGYESARNYGVGNVGECRLPWAGLDLTDEPSGSS